MKLCLVYIIWAIFAQSLRIDSPINSCSVHGTSFPFSYHDTHITSCYCHQDLHSQAFYEGLHHKPYNKTKISLQILTRAILWELPYFGSALERHPFSRPIDSTGEFLHTPYRMSTSITTILLYGSVNTLYSL